MLHTQQSIIRYYQHSSSLEHEHDRQHFIACPDIDDLMAPKPLVHRLAIPCLLDRLQLLPGACLLARAAARHVAGLVAVADAAGPVHGTQASWSLDYLLPPTNEYQRHAQAFCCA